MRKNRSQINLNEQRPVSAFVLNLNNTNTTANFNGVSQQQVVSDLKKKVNVLCGELEKLIAYNNILLQEKQLCEQRYAVLQSEAAAQRTFICRGCQQKDRQISMLNAENRHLAKLMQTHTEVAAVVSSSSSASSSTAVTQGDTQIQKNDQKNSHDLPNTVVKPQNSIDKDPLDNLKQQIVAIEEELLSLEDSNTEEQNKVKKSPTRRHQCTAQRVPTSYLQVLEKIMNQSPIKKDKSLNRSSSNVSVTALLSAREHSNSSVERGTMKSRTTKSTTLNTERLYEQSSNSQKVVLSARDYGRRLHKSEYSDLIASLSAKK